MIRPITSFGLVAILTSIAAAQCSPTWQAGSGRAGPPHSDLFAVHDGGNGPTLWAANTWGDVAHPIWFWNVDHWQDANLVVTGGLYSMASVTLDGEPSLMVMGGQILDGSAQYFTGVLRSGTWTLFETAGAGWTIKQVGNEILAIKPTSSSWSPSALQRWEGNHWEPISGAIDGATNQLIETPMGLCTAEINYSLGPMQLRVLCLRPGQTEWEVLGATPLDPNRNNDWNRLSWNRDRLVLAGSFNGFEGAAGPVVAYTSNGWESLEFHAGGEISGLWNIDDELVIAHARYGGVSTTLLTFVDGQWIPFLRDHLGNFTVAEADGSGWIAELFSVRHGEGHQLIATGSFDRAAHTPAMSAAFLDRDSATSHWIAFGGGTSGSVTNLAQTDQGLVALGGFTQLEDSPVSLGAIQHNGTQQWQPLVHSIRYDTTQSLPLWAKPVVFRDKLIVAGSFLGINGIDANYIAAIDGSNTVALDSGVQRTDNLNFNNWAPVWGMVEYQGALITYGTFAIAGGIDTGPIASWNGAEWSGVASVTQSGGWPPIVSAATVYHGDLVIAGNFDNVESTSVVNIARFDGDVWQSMGAIEIRDGALNFPIVMQFAQYNDHLYVGISNWLSLSEDSIIREWNGEEWVGLPPPHPLGFGAAISRLEIFNGQLMACGSDWGGQRFVSFWNDSEWQSLGGINGSITDSAVDGNTLVVCGHFSRTATGASQSLARLTCLCAADFNADSSLDFTDYLDFVSAFATSNPAADFNSDGLLDVFDYLDFVHRFAAGC